MYGFLYDNSQPAAGGQELAGFYRIDFKNDVLICFSKGYELFLKINLKLQNTVN